MSDRRKRRSRKTLSNALAASCLQPWQPRSRRSRSGSALRKVFAVILLAGAAGCGSGGSGDSDLAGAGPDAQYIKETHTLISQRFANDAAAVNLALKYVDSVHAISTASDAASRVVLFQIMQELGLCAGEEGLPVIGEATLILLRTDEAKQRWVEVQDSLPPMVISFPDHC